MFMLNHAVAEYRNQQNNQNQPTEEIIMTTKTIITTGTLLLSLCVAQAQPAADTFAPRSDGFIRDWLVFAPIMLPRPRSLIP